MSIERMLVLSTGHLTKETALDMDNPSSIEAQEWREELIVYPHGEYGWLIYVPDDGYDAEFPHDLEICLSQARYNDCPWLLLDRDGDTVDALPSYNW